jgi:rubrerythrin
MTLQGAIQQLYDMQCNEKFPIYYKPAIDEVIKTIVADAQEVRRGRWEHYEHREPQYDIEGYKTWAEAYKCSNCGFIHTVIEDFGHYAFCPRCGARMEEGGE